MSSRSSSTRASSSVTSITALDIYFSSVEMGVPALAVGRSCQSVDHRAQETGAHRFGEVAFHQRQALAEGEFADQAQRHVSSWRPPLDSRRGGPRRDTAE